MRDDLNSTIKLAIITLALFSVPEFVQAKAITFDFSGAISFTEPNEDILAVGDKFNGYVTFDPSTPGVFNNLGLSAQYDNAISKFHVAFSNGLHADYASGPADIQMQDGVAAHDYSLTYYTGTNLGATISSNISPPHYVAAFGLYLRSTSAAALPDGTSIPLSPPPLGPFDTEAALEFSWLPPSTPDGLFSVFTRGQLTSFTLAAGIPEPASIAILGFALALSLLGRRRRA